MPDPTPITAWVQFLTEVLIAIGVGYNTLQAIRAKVERKAIAEKQAVAVEVAAVTAATVNEVHDSLAHVNSTVTKVEAKVDEVHKATNGMRDALVVAAKEEALARGIAVGLAGAAIRTDDQVRAIIKSAEDEKKNGNGHPG